MAQHILLVDDDPDYLLATRMQLEAAGYDVTAAADTAAAQEALAAQRPDAAVVDLMMEEADAGFGLCYRIKRLDDTIPVILVSAVTSETGLDFRVTGDAAKTWVRADAFLSKPVRFEQLQRELERLLAARVARR